MNSLIGHPIEDAQRRYGAAEQVIPMPDGAKVYQFRSGGVPALSKGCLLNFTARQRGDRWVIEKADLRDMAQC